MSNDHGARDAAGLCLARGARALARGTFLACALGSAACALVWSALARADENPIDAYARWVVSQGRWAGPTVAYPDAESRPQLPWALESDLRPLRLHAGARVRVADAERVLGALERAYDYLVETGWPLPFPDGGRGGSGGFDLYLVDGPPVVRVAIDAPVTWAPLDAATSWAALGATVVRDDDDALDACVLAALTEAALFGQDPAEDAVWRRATGAFVAYLATGRFGCDDDAGEGAALFLAMLSERQGGAPGAFVREAWQLARQKSEGARLRGSPHLGEAFERALDNAGESLERILEDFAVARWFVGHPARRAGAPYAVLRALPSDAAVPILAEFRAERAAKRFVVDPPLGTGDSAYARVALDPGLVGTTLPVWLVAQPGARWSLSLVKLGSDDHELGRIAAPPRRVPKSFVPLVVEEGARALLIVVSALPERASDVALPSDAEHHALVIVGERPE